MKDIFVDVLSDIVAKLVKNLQPEKIISFGSYAYGEPNEESDVDLLVIVSESNEPSYRRACDAYRALRGVGVPKDIIVMTQQEIEWKMKVVPNSLVSQALH